ncbi:hypothetical protein BD309DRAFT_313489 [Dichomitus squalens]|uniref:Uncharacterized protein n=1 Tax=Dichomitus squalens TaxID=114155 RepID=A0A4Q9NNR2_9APHY|nr:hypothetical protein BD309DRAFT_313489 [Dichomitus squalens]TBU51940.1 hypothetical protein BD310DRAFT_275898 [Dichomitus squalens]
MGIDNTGHLLIFHPHHHLHRRIVTSASAFASRLFRGCFNTTSAFMRCSVAKTPALPSPEIRQLRIRLWCHAEIYGLRALRGAWTMSNPLINLTGIRPRLRRDCSLLGLVRTRHSTCGGRNIGRAVFVHPLDARADRSENTSASCRILKIRLLRLPSRSYRLSR